MSLKLAVAALAACAPLGVVSKPAAPAEDMRLIKTSAADPGTWVTKEQKYEMVKSKGARGHGPHYIDITNIKDEQVLDNLSGKLRSVARTAQYPGNLSHVEEANKLIETASVDNARGWLEHMASYKNRHCESDTGVEAATWLFDKVKEIGSTNKAITVEQFEHFDFDQKSLIARIPGGKDELVVVGAHFDSISGGPQDKAPGADDNASGSVTVLESFRVLAEAGFAPEKTLEFHWYAGEEIGLVGSADVWADYKDQGKAVYSYVNQDMTGYQTSGTPAVITDNTDKSLNEYVKLLVTQYTGKAPNTDVCGYGCSDHASATANDFPAAFLFEDLFNKSSPYIHSPNDTPDHVMWEAVERHIKFSIGYLVEASYN